MRQKRTTWPKSAGTALRERQVSCTQSFDGAKVRIYDPTLLGLNLKIMKSAIGLGRR
jgi:hypothetical protein